MSLDVVLDLTIRSGSGLILMGRVGVAHRQTVSVLSWHPGPAHTEVASPQSGEQTWLTGFGFLTSRVVIMMMADLRHLIRAAKWILANVSLETKKFYLKDFSTIKCLSAWPSSGWIFEFNDSSDISLPLSIERPPGPENRNCCLAWLVWIITCKIFLKMLKQWSPSSFSDFWPLELKTLSPWINPRWQDWQVCCF